MPETSPVRPARRAAARRKQLVESSDEDENVALHSHDDDSEDFAAPPQKSPRRQSRRTAKSVQMTPLAVNRTQTASITDDVEPSEIFSPLSSVAPEPISPPKKARAPRKSVRASRRVSIAPDSVPLPPAPSTSMTPGAELIQSNGAADTALMDITAATVNGKASVSAESVDVVKLEKKAPAFEKPMDIVVRTRALAAPVVEEPSIPRSRIVITYLVLTNFKSYAGRQHVGPFHSSFSSVVGPNGSGKSNVIDSLLFVFGFRASKMRQGKISALIHSSAAYPDLNHCEVEVQFQEVIDKPSGTEVVPDSTLIISRKAFKNNSSKYYINSSESNFTEVTTLLRDRGVDLDHKRFLILQGEVESIAQMKPKAANEHDDGLLEYLEDIIGTSKYKTPIEESGAEVEQLNEVCAEKNTRVQHVEKEKNSLESKKDAALAYIRDENELAIKQSSLYQIFLNECEDNIEIASSAVSQAQAQLDAELEKHQGSEEAIKTLQKQYNAQVKAVERFKKDAQAKIDQISKLDKESVKIEEKKKHLNIKLKKLEKAKATAQATSSEAAAHLQRLADDLQRNTSTMAKLENEMAVEEEELATIRQSLQGKTQGLSDEISKKQKKLEPWIQQINEKQSEIAVAQSELTILQEGDNAGAQAIAEAQAKVARLEEEKIAKAAELQEFQSKLAQLEKEVHKVQKALDELSQREPTIRSKLSSARQKADEAKSNFSKSKSQGDVLNGLMRLKESGRISGFHGRLGNLGAIDQKYDIAISTACPALDNLVVDSVEVGQQCIEYLRKNNLGRANLILLDRLTQRDLSTIKTPENVPRLFDLVRSKDDKFLPAFYSVLQNTLVAEDLDQANRIAYGAQRWRVVTLDGQLIDKSGTMSGGGTRVAKGSMSSKLASDTTKEQVTKLEADQASQEKDFEEFQQQQQDLTSRLQDIRDQMPELQTSIQKLFLGIESVERNQADAQRRVTELSTSKQPTGSDKNRVMSLQKSISRLEGEVSKLQQEASGMEEEVKALQDKIMEIGGVKLRYQKSRVDGLKEQVDTLNEEMSNAEVTRARTEKQMVKQNKAREDAVKELESLTRDLQKVDEDAQSQHNDATGSRREAEEAQEALEAKNEELVAVQAQVDSKTAELNETRGIEIEMRNKLEENQKILVENQKRLSYWQEKLSKLSIQNVNDLGEELPEQSLALYTRDELADLDKNSLKGEIALLEERTQNVNVELSVLAEYRRRVEEHEQRSSDLAEAVGARDTAKKRCEELRRLRLGGFMEGFSTISLRLKEMYQMITMGGNAELELVDSLDPFSEGILFSVMPPKKSWKNISNLSGGEKTLSSLALVFALHHYKPTPLYVMDEIDAALDFRNVSIVASYIKERTKNAQFIVISLRNNMFELASRLVGVYKVNHMTKSVTVNNKDYINRSAATGR